MRGKRIHLGFPSQPRAGLRGSDRRAAQATISTEGLDESVAKDHQAQLFEQMGSVHGEVRRLSASLEVACWAENEITRVLRLSGEASGTERRRWQIELFFKELKSTLGFSQYSFIDFRAVEAWVNLAITTVLYLEYERITHMLDRRLSQDRQQWWHRQRLHGLCHAFRQEAERKQLEYIEKRIKTSGGLKKLQRLLAATIPQEYRVAA